MTPPVVTVLITTYNYGRFIEEAIDSVLAQEFPQEQVEIVVIDDGSTDDTSERVKKYGSRLRYFYQANGGQAAALNAGFANARGEIVALLDADDMFLPGRLARVAESFQQNPALAMVYHRMLEWNMETDERRENSFPLVSGDVKTVPSLFLYYIPQATSCISFRRASLNRLLPIPEHIRMLADGYLVDLIPFLSPILAMPEVLVVYRLHGKNCFYTDDRKAPKEVRKVRLEMRHILVDAMRKWLAENGFTKKQLPVRVFLNWWNLFLQGEGFLIKPPSRVRYFRFILLENYAANPIQSWKLTLFNYLSAFSALVFGYKKADLMYAWRGRSMEVVQDIYRRFRRARSRQGSSS